MLSAGDKAPSFTLPAVDGGGTVSDPWGEGQTVLTFFKVSCPVCKMVAPMTQFAEQEGQRVPTLTEGAPYDISQAYGLEAVPSLFLIDADGIIQDSIAGWNRDSWNNLAASAGVAAPLSIPDDGLRPFRPG